MIDDEAINKFLDGKLEREVPDTQKIEQFLNKPPEEKQGEKTPQVNQQKSLLTPVTDYATAINNEFLDLVGLPGDAFDWAAEKLGSDLRVGGSAQLREMGKSIGMGTDTPGQEPDTASYRAGHYTALGLEFLAPMLSWGRNAKVMASAPSVAGSTANVGKGTGTLIAEKISAPFVAAPQTAYAAELAAGAGSGIGSFYGEQEGGIIGEQIGGLAGGIAPQPLIHNSRRAVNYTLKTVIPFMEKGGRAKVGGIFNALAEAPDIRAAAEASEANIAKNLSGKGFKATSARLAQDEHLMALEKYIVDRDPVLARELRIQDDINNRIASMALAEKVGDASIVDAQKVLGSKFMKLNSRINAGIDLRLNNVKEQITKLSSPVRRKVANIQVKAQIQKALDDAREVETKIWGEVDKGITAPVKHTQKALEMHLRDRFQSDDPAEIPNFVRKFLGDVKNDKFVPGKFKPEESVGELHSFRSRILKEVRKERAAEVPDWNKLRILGDIEQSVLTDISTTPAGAQLDDALNYSRSLNQKFSGDIMSVIMRHSKTGGTMSPELTLENLGTGPKGAVQIRKILDASPDSAGNVEEILKMDLALSKVIKDDRIDLTKAKQYMLRNEDTMDIFPDLKANLEKAISLEEKAAWYTKSAKIRSDKASKSLSKKLSEVKPKSFLTNIMTEGNPSQAMRTQLRRLTPRGKEGVKNDIIDLITKKSGTGKTHTDGTPELSGDKAFNYWTANKKTLGIPFTVGEKKRVESIIQALKLTDKVQDLPMHAATEIMTPKQTPLTYVVETMAARLGAGFGAGTSGASLKTASQASNTARRVLGNLSGGTAKQLIKDSIQDPELFKALSEEVSFLTPDSKSWAILQGWMVAHAVNNLEGEE